MNIQHPIVHVLALDDTVPAALRTAASGDVEWTVVGSPLELLGLCSRVPPLFVAIHLSVRTETWLTAIEVLLEQPGSPRMLLLTEPGVLDETLTNLYRDGTDELLLWPATREQLHRSLDRMFRPGGGCNRQVGLVPGGPHDSGR